jgi:hypothetical protein
MSAYGTKQTSVCVVTMSALKIKRAMDTSEWVSWMAPRTALKNIASPVRGSLRSRDYRPSAVAPARLSFQITNHWQKPTRPDIHASSIQSRKGDC